MRKHDDSPLSRRLLEAQTKIADTFLQQCVHGKQRKALPNDMTACGQFLGDDALTVDQMGLHGSAAALQVLSTYSSDDARAEARRLVSFFGIVFGEPKDVEVERRTSELLSPHEHNVIKISEILYSLSLVQPGIAPKEELVEKLAARLQGAIGDNKGWSYFLDDDTGITEILPTAYAARALEANGYAVDGPLGFLRDQVTGPGDGTSPRARIDISLQVLVL